VPRKFIEKLYRIDFFIRTKSTGSPDDFCERLDISKSTLFEYLKIMKEHGAPIKWDKYKNSYYYEFEGKFKFFFKKNTTPDISD
jgi:hypothetical protein